MYCKRFLMFYLNLLQLSEYLKKKTIKFIAISEMFNINFVLRLIKDIKSFYNNIYDIVI